MFFKKISFLFLLFTFSLVCSSQNSETKSTLFFHSGRLEILEENKVILIGLASSVSFDFKGNSCSISLQSLVDHQNYISLEIDGNYLVESGTFKIMVGGSSDKGLESSFELKQKKQYEFHELALINW